jgi:transposase
MAQFNDLSRSFTAFDQDSTLLRAVEMSAKSWLVAALVPGVPRQPLKKMEACEGKLLAAIASWREEAEKAGRPVKRVVVAYEAGRDGFWLARLLKAHGIEAYVIHPSSIPVSREHKRAKTDRLDAAMLLRALLGWLRGERKHCQMAEIPSAEAEDERRLGRERERLVGERTRIVNRIKSLLAVLGVRGFNPKLKKAAEKLAALRTADGLPVPTNARAQILRLLQRLSLVRSQIAEIESERLERLEANKEDRANRMVALLAR